MKNINLKPGWIKAFALFISLTFLQNRVASACEACKKQQPKLLQGITHGPGPDSKWDGVIVAIMVCITLYVLFATAKCLFKPMEKEDQHIKRLILNNWGE